MATFAMAGVAPFTDIPATSELPGKQRCWFPSHSVRPQRTSTWSPRTASSSKVVPLAAGDERELSGNDRPPPSVEGPATRQKAVFDETVVEPRGVADFIEQAKEMVREVARDGGPLRWFTPLECDARERLDGAPTLLYLPGIDGVGFGLIKHHQRLKRIFDLWCLHIPVTDKTPFEGIVEYVELSLRSQNAHLQNKPIYIAGESLGACLALAVAARNPDIDFVLILVNPATSFCKSNLHSILSLSDIVPEALHSTMAPLQSLVGNSIRIPFPELQNPLTAVTHSVAVMFSYLSFVVDVLPAKSLIWRLKMLNSASLYANSRLHAIRSQILILASVKDQLFPNRAEAERICSLLPSCRIRIFEESDHTILLERGIDLVTIIKGAGYYRRSSQTNSVTDYLLPTRSEFHEVIEKFRWVVTATSPVMFSTLENGEIVKGLAGIPIDGPAIVVGYHMFMGLELGPLVSEFLTKKNILLRGIAHPFMFQKRSELMMPNTSDFDHVRIMGAVPVSAANFYRLLSEKSFVLLYPGGVREALHRKGEQYKLFWPDQSEMVRMAARFGATIIPFGAVGEDDIFELLFDYNDLVKFPFYDKMVLERANKGTKKLRTNSTGEVANEDLYLPAALPKIPGRFYFMFGKPIETKGRNLEINGRKKAHELYAHVKSEVESCLNYLKKKREQDPYRNILSRLIYQASNGFTSEVPTFDP